MTGSPTTNPRPRWWPAGLIVVLAGARLGWLWTGNADQLQDRVVPSLLTAVFAAGALLLWLLFLSRLPWKTRGKTLLGVFGAVALFVLLFRFEGFSGDLLPIFSWRLAPSEPLAEARGTAETTTSADDFPQFLGPQRNATIPETRLDRDWQAKPPKELWRRPVGNAWSAFAVVGNAAVTQERRGAEEAVARYDLKSGEVVWVTSYPGHFESPVGGNGPRATPTLADGRVFAYGSTGVLTSLDLRDGSIVWQRQTAEETAAEAPDWGFAGSPLVHGNVVIVAPGGADGNSLVAYDRDTGEPRWSVGDDPASYSSPLFTELAGIPQIVSRNHTSITGHDPTDGRVLWRYPWPGEQPNVAQPLVLGNDRLLISSGYGIGATLLRLRAEGGDLTAEEVWASTRLKAKFTNLVQLGGRIYGLDDGVLVCIDPETGERCWKKGRYGHGQPLLVGDLLLLVAEDGDVVLIEPNPEGLRELARFTALDGKSWNTPALAGRYLLVRNADEAACYELPLMPG